MAKRLKYVPQARPEDTAQQELDQLVETLHETGTLRLLNGLIGRFSQVSEVALHQLDTPSGRTAMSNVAISAAALSKIGSDRLQVLVDGVAEGLEAAHLRMPRRAPSIVRLLSLLTSSETRRSIFALLVVLQSLGQRVEPEQAPPRPRELSADGEQRRDA